MTRIVNYCKSYWALYNAREHARDELNAANGANRHLLQAKFEQAQKAMDDHRRDCHACPMTVEVMEGVR
jgi:hypothetical protein